MTIYKCDLCQKELTDKKDQVYISQGYILRGHYLCSTCGKPVLDFMGKHQFLEV
jgi:DNA-directed RNA polymerase subunit RPC12/RpoP